MASENVDQSTLNVVTEFPQSVLPTALFRVRNAKRTFEYLRFICDSGAQINLISEPAFRQLGLIRQSNRLSIFGAGGSGVMTRGRADLELWHRTEDNLIAQTYFIIIDGMHSQMPNQSFDRVNFDQVPTHKLADPSYNTSASIDGIIGVTLLAKHLQPQLLQGPLGLMAQETSFGWIVFGGQYPPDNVDLLTTIGVVTLSDIYNLIKRFWEIEDSIEDQLVLSPEDISCEQLYQSSGSIRNMKYDRRYAVTIMLKPDAVLGNSRATALRRLYALERRFQREPEMQEKYKEFMRQYRDLGHMIEAEPLHDETAMHYYIPHHGVAIDRKFDCRFFRTS